MICVLCTCISWPLVQDTSGPSVLQEKLLNKINKNTYSNQEANFIMQLQKEVQKQPSCKKSVRPLL